MRRYLFRLDHILFLKIGSGEAKMQYKPHSIVLLQYLCFKLGTKTVYVVKICINGQCFNFSLHTRIHSYGKKSLDSNPRPFDTETSMTLNSGVMGHNVLCMQTISHNVPIPLHTPVRISKEAPPNLLSTALGRNIGSITFTVGKTRQNIMLNECRNAK